MAIFSLVILQLLATVLADKMSVASSVTPSEKVVKMLKDLHEEVKAEGETETENFEKFTTFCTTGTETKTKAIKEGEDKIEELNSTKISKTADFEQLQDEITEAKNEKEKLEKDKEDSERQFQKDKATFEATDADLDAAIKGLEAATAKLKASASAKAAGFLQFDFLDQSFDLAEAMGFLESPRRKEVTAFLQSKADPWNEKEGEEHNKKEYEFQSSGIVQTLEDLHKEFSDESTKVTTAFTATKASADDFKETTSEAIENKETEIGNKEETASTTKGEADAAEEEMLKTLKILKDDKTYLSELTATCEARTTDYTQRQANRKGEMEALDQATKVMEDTVMDLDSSVNGEMAEAADFLQETSETHLVSAARAVSDNVQTESTELSVEAQAQGRLNLALANEAVSMVARAGSALHSFRMQGLALRMQMGEDPSAAGDTLGFVKNMVQDLINKLLKEAEAESSQKGFCDSEMGKASNQRDRRNREALKLNAKLKGLDNKRTELMEEEELLVKDITKLNEDLSEATEARVKDSTANQKTIKECKEAFVAVKSAIKTLNDFYAKANRMAKKHDKKDLDVKAQKEIRDAAVPEGSYKGKQQQSFSIVTMMEVVRDDFHTTDIETTEEEEKATKEFKKFKMASMEDIAGKTTKKELVQEDFKTTENDLEAKKAELTTTIGLLDDALKTLEDLKPQCVDNVMSYEERVAKRDKEIESLKTAMCALDPEGKEDACKK